jgi:hypothetical protein
MGKVATVLIGELEGRAFKEEVGEFGEFAHEGDEREFGRFAGRPQALIKGPQHRVVTRRVTSAPSRACAGVRAAVGAGWNSRPYSASTAALMGSFLARWSWARAKWRTSAGLSTLTGRGRHGPTFPSSSQPDKKDGKQHTRGLGRGGGHSAARWMFGALLTGVNEYAGDSSTSPARPVSRT